MKAYRAEQIRENLLNTMRKYDISMNAWAHRAGITEGTLRNFLAGRSNSLQLGNAIELAAALNIPLLDLIYGDESHKYAQYGPTGPVQEEMPLPEPGQMPAPPPKFEHNYLKTVFEIASAAFIDRDLPVDPDRLSFIAAKLIGRYSDKELLLTRGPGYVDSFFDY